MQVLHSEIQVFWRTLIAWVTSHSNLSATRAFIWSLKIKLIKEHLMGKDTKIPFFRCCLGIQNCIKNIGTKVTYDIGYQKGTFTRWKDFECVKVSRSIFLWHIWHFIQIQTRSQSMNIYFRLFPNTWSWPFSNLIYVLSICNMCTPWKKAFYIDIVFLWSTLDIWNKT